jgi:hypothetical protein
LAELSEVLSVSLGGGGDAGFGGAEMRRSKCGGHRPPLQVIGLGFEEDGQGGRKSQKDGVRKMFMTPFF